MLTRRSRSNRPFSRAGAVRGAPRQFLSVLSLGIPLAILAQALTSCGSDDSDQACTPDEPKACALAGQTCAAVQICNADGSAYGACACPGGGTGGSAGSAGASSGNVGGSSNGGAAGAGPLLGDPLFEPSLRAIGAPCTTDAECPTGPAGEAPLTCITASSTAQFGGGPQGGYCSAACADTDECQALDGLSACGLIDPATNTGYCIGLCVPGTSNVKCFTDRAQACFALPDDPGIGACFPVCQNDAGCGQGLFCDLGAGELGVCTAAAPVGGDIGAACTAETALADCKSGVCLELVDPSGVAFGSFCSANCTFGLLEGCGYERVTATPREALCGTPQSPTGAGGDLGFCLEFCDTDAECAQAAAGWLCSPLAAADQPTVGRTGVCSLPDAPAGADAGAP